MNSVPFIDMGKEEFVPYLNKEGEVVMRVDAVDQGRFGSKISWAVKIPLETYTDVLSLRDGRILLSNESSLSLDDPVDRKAIRELLSSGMIKVDFKSTCELTSLYQGEDLGLQLEERINRALIILKIKRETMLSLTIYLEKLSSLIDEIPSEILSLDEIQIFLQKMESLTRGVLDAIVLDQMNRLFYLLAAGKNDIE